MTLFSTRGLVKQFGSLRATDNVSIDVAPNEVHALIGPNGAGKSTLVNLISGMLPADGGSIVLDGVDLTGMPPHKRVRAGLSRCFQVTNLFKKATVLSNLMLAVQSHRGSSFLPLGRRDGETALAERAVELAGRVGLGGELDRIAGSLPHGAQRQLDVALALAADPKLLLLDEPMAGMGPDESARMVELIQLLRRDMAILLIEHDMDAVFKLADRISVLVYGKVLASGNAEQIKSHPEVQAVYLGSEVEA
ncbi:ATP-binding cassette domain-containing protein [Azoarcus sp. TTM-91]|uniref:ABC transporter ATP-binding protein n=1 Tax=Azoarcus sp. TTM-91 TaxID=2691581 RepID=UPI00145C6AEC|nr:ABC transporter ATP-binding protein [Azoarcus sp. TTM-91]NMG33486.1 ATP-binding cassette domain-containing protein [Azoarcus sp. TTM-91]